MAAIGHPAPHLGNYRLIRPLGSGGFAEVYLGEHIYLGMEAAIKVPRARLGPEVLARFREEARTAARLRHPHIIGIFDFVVLQETAFIVMDYAPAGTLRHRHPRGTRLHPATILTYLKQVGAALDYAHSQHCIHCDLKPENMLIGRRNEILLSDFGIAAVEAQARQQRNEAIAGTVAYMAPEQLAGQPQCSSDQYALGVVVYEWLCGVCPFRGSPAEVLAQQINAAPPPLSQLAPTVPAALARVVERALAKRPEERYPGVLAFVEAFEAALLSSYSPEERSGSSRRRVMLALTSLAMSGLLGGGLAWLALAQRSHTPARPPRCPLPLRTPAQPVQAPAHFSSAVEGDLTASHGLTAPSALCYHNHCYEQRPNY